jgi:hypothetical protein
MPEGAARRPRVVPIGEEAPGVNQLGGGRNAWSCGYQPASLASSGCPARSSLPLSWREHCAEPGLDVCLALAATPRCASDDPPDARVMQSQIVADPLHGISAARIGGLDRFISVSMRPVVFWQRARNGPTLRLGHLAPAKLVRHLPLHGLYEGVRAQKHTCRLRDSHGEGSPAPRRRSTGNPQWLAPPPRP